VHFVSPVDIGLLLPSVTCHEYTPFNFLGITDKDVNQARDVLWAVAKLASLIP
jgi:hypothetical protein